MEGADDTISAGTISRRRALGLGLGTAAAIGLGACSFELGPDEERNVLPTADPAGRKQRVVVIGAGLAGLTAALDLAEAGWEVVVLEARDRVGGRVHTVRAPFSEGLHAEAGGESIDIDHAAMLAMLDRFGLGTEDRPANKIVEGVTSFEGRRRSTAAFVTEDDGEVAADYERFYAALDELAAGIDPEHPERSDGAMALDQRSAGDFLDELKLNPKAHLLAETDLRAGYNAEPAALSLLFLAQQSAVGTDVPDAGVEALRVIGGNDQLPKALAAELDDVRLGTPVRAIIWSDDAAEVVAGDAAIAAAHVVVAVPFPALRNVRFQPALPGVLPAAIRELELGPAGKVTIEYERPFWEDEGGSGFTVTDQPFGVAWASTDSYEPPSGGALLTAFLTGEAAHDASDQSAAVRTTEIRQQFDEVYPEGAALATSRSATLDWITEEYTGGGYVAYAPGQLTAFWSAIRKGIGPIRFAGEHTEALAGYMESAIRSGHRVAEEIGPPQN